MIQLDLFENDLFKLLVWEIQKLQNMHKGAFKRIGELNKRVQELEKERR